MLLPTLAGAQHANSYVYSNLPGNPNYVMYESSIFPTVNRCEWFSVQEGFDYFLPHGFMAEKATYNATPTNLLDYTAIQARTYSGMYGDPNGFRTQGYGIYLPYAFTLPANVMGYELVSYKSHDIADPADNTFVFMSRTAFEANKPYTIRLHGATADVTSDFATADIYVPASPVGLAHDSVPHIMVAAPTSVTDIRNNSTASGETVTSTLTRKSVKDHNGVTWTIYGTTEKVDGTTPTTMSTAWSDGSYVFASDGNWWPVKDNNWAIGALRPFLHPDTPGAVASKELFGGFIDGGTTGIGDITNDDEPANSPIYNIGGQYMGTDINVLPKGIYVVNGKKIVK